MNNRSEELNIVVFLKEDMYIFYSSLFLYIEAQVDNPNYKSRTEPAGNLILIIKLLFEFMFIALSSTFHSPLKRTSKVDNEPGTHGVIKTNGSTFEKWIKTIWQNCSRKAAFFPRISSHQKLHFPKIARNSSKTFCMLSATR